MLPNSFKQSPVSRFFAPSIALFRISDCLPTSLSSAGFRGTHVIGRMRDIPYGLLVMRFYFLPRLVIWTSLGSTVGEGVGGHTPSDTT